MASVENITIQNVLVNVAYDYVSTSSLTTDGQPLVMLFKTGGASGTLVKTLTFTYSLGASGGNFLTVIAT